MAGRQPRRQSATLDKVLKAITPGRTTRLNLTYEQKYALRDKDGQIALDVVRHLLGARATITTKPGRFPLTEATFQAVAAKRGHRVGIKRSRALIRRLLAARVLEPAGSYRQPYRNRPGNSGYRVPLFQLSRGVFKAILGTTSRSGLPRGKPPVGGRLAVKRRRSAFRPSYGSVQAAFGALGPP